MTRTLGAVELVGRDHELARIGRARRAAGDGEPRVIAIAGEAGIGKAPSPGQGCELHAPIADSSRTSGRDVARTWIRALRPSPAVGFYGDLDGLLASLTASGLQQPVSDGVRQRDVDRYIPGSG